MSKNKYEVTVCGLYKLIAAIVLIVYSVAYVSPVSMTAGLSMLVYSLMFVFLAVNGSNHKVAKWFADRKFFFAVFFMPTVFCAFYSAAMYFASDRTYLDAFAALLTVLSIPFAFILMKVQCGIRRWDAFVAFFAFPISLFVLCSIFKVAVLTAAGGAVVIVVLVFIVAANIQHAKEHRADSDSKNDYADGGYHHVARWDGGPDSKVENNVVYLRGTIVVEYKGAFNMRYAEVAVGNLINAYADRVAKDMPGYTLDKNTNITVRYVEVN